MDHCSFFEREAKFCSRLATNAAYKFAALIFPQRPQRDGNMKKDTLYGYLSFISLIVK